MKTLAAILLATGVTALAGCGAATQVSKTVAPTEISMEGTWTVTFSANGASSTSQFSLTTVACSVLIEEATYNLFGPSCFQTEGVSGGPGLYYPLQAVYASAPSASFSTSSPEEVNFLFIEGDESGDFVQYGGACTLTVAPPSPAMIQCGGTNGSLNDGTISNGVLTGSWSCASPPGAGTFCGGTGKKIPSDGTFSGTQQ